TKRGDADDARMPPPWRQYTHWHGKFLRSPHAVAIGRLHAQGVVARRQPGVGDVLLVAVFDPAGIEAVEAVAVLDVGRRCVVERAYTQSQQDGAIRDRQGARLPQRAVVAGDAGAYARGDQPQRRQIARIGDATRVEQVQAAHTAKGQAAVAERGDGRAVE